MSSDGYTYGNISLPRTAGVLGMSGAATAAAGVGAVVALVLLMVGLPMLGLGALGVGVLFAALLSLSKVHGRSLPERWVGRWLYGRSKKKGSTRYVAGPASSLPDGSFRAPGLLAATELEEYTDHYGQKFALLWNPTVKTGTVFFSAAGPGPGLLDQSSIDQLVAGWSLFLQDAGASVDLPQVAVTTTSAADPGERLPAAVAAARARASVDTVNDFARQTVDEIVAGVNTGVPRVGCRIAATFSAGEAGQEELPARTADELAADIASLLPGLMENLSKAGAGSVSMITTQDLIDDVHVAYNPAAALAVEKARLSGEGTGLGWHDVGPSFAHAHRDAYEHDEALSRTWQAWLPPQGVFQDNSLQALLAPDSSCVQKRMTVLYRPLTPDQSVAAVRTQVTNTSFEANQKGAKVSAVMRVAQEKAQQSEREQAEGAAMVRFGLMVTATVNDASQLKRAEAHVRRACMQGVQLEVRSCRGNEDAAFAIGLGLGAVPGNHATLPASLRQSL